MAEIKDPMSDADDLTSREIRDNIRRTRAQMDATVDAIEEKLTPGELIHEAWGLFRGGSSSSVNRIWRIVKQHPMPAAIIGAGVGWMVYESTGGNSGARRAGYVRYDDEWSPEGEVPTALDSARRRAAGGARRASDAARGLVDEASDKASDVADSVRRATETAGEKAGELTGQAREMASDVAGAVRRQASDLGDQARRGMREASTGFWDTLEEQPLVIGAATLAAGLLVGLLLPSTAQEDELMGKTRDSLLDEVKGLGQEALESGKQIASSAAETLKQGAEEHGLSADKVAEKARAVGRDLQGSGQQRPQSRIA